MEFSEGQCVHMIGVCGVGMAGLARLLVSRGMIVSGCDAYLNELSAGLKQAGVCVCRGHSPSHIDGLPENAVVVVTPAVAAGEPEILAARERGLRVVRRGEVLASLVSDLCGIAVCGTHGKTTTACFTARLLQELGASPGWCIGGYTRGLGGVACPAPGELLVVEADESDGTLRHYRPAITVLANIDIDHLEHFKGEDDLVDCFREALTRTRGKVCVCRDDPRAWSVACGCGSALIGFGFHPDASLRAENVEIRAGGCGFDLVFDGSDYGRIEIGVGGRHNIINALGAAAAAIAYGFDLDDIVRALPAACRELPARRFEEIGSLNGARCVADYAHHPSELRAAVQMALDCRPERVVAVFQPHRYTRTLAMGKLFPASFEGVDELLLLPVYAASEEPLEGGDICDLYAQFRDLSPDLRVTLCRDLRECARYLKNAVAPGDLVLIAGAGDVISLREHLFIDAGERLEFPEAELARQPGVRLERNRVLSGLSVFPTRGRGAVASVSSVEALQGLVAFCRAHAVKYRPAGSGFNSWYSDCGCDRLLIRLTGDAFGEVVFDGASVRAGCGMGGPRLLDLLQEKGLSGLEFMEGIPGSLGGWLAMNAGAHGGSIADCVESVEIVDGEGIRVELTAAECGFGYRQCEALRSAVAVSCRLRLVPASSERIAGVREAFRGKRIPLQGLRTAGSVFRNPQGEFAGKLLELAGCKGLRAGGAFVVGFHANIVAVDEGATASDVLALVQMMRRRVSRRFGVELECEIDFVERREE